MNGRMTANPMNNNQFDPEGNLKVTIYMMVATLALTTLILLILSRGPVYP